MDDNLHKEPDAPPHTTEVLVKCAECGQLFDRSNPAQVRYHEYPGHKPRQRHNLS